MFLETFFYKLRSVVLWMNKIRLATVFSGIGAIEFALKRLHIDYDIVFACDNGERDIEYNHDKEFKNILALKTIDEKCAYVDRLYDSLTRRTNFVEKSYLANYSCPKSRYFQDIKLLDGCDFADNVDLFVGGSPCQSFSSVGFKGGLEDTRGTLFYEFARLVREIKPKVFIYENVRNLFNHDNGKTWHIIRNVFDELGYDIHYSILNSADYNIPQNRRRLFVVGFKKPLQFDMPTPEKLQFDMHDFLEDNCAYPNFSYDETGKLVVGKIKGKINPEYYLTPLLYRYVMKGGTKTFYQKPEINKPIARTVLKTMGNRHRAGVDNYVSPDFSNDFGKVRMLTEREAHRLMGFTDDYKIVVSKSQAYKQAGNSIVVDVLMKLIKQIIECGGLENDN